MLKALLVDDDMHMLDFLQKMIPWESVGFCVCGAAATGAAALARVQARQINTLCGEKNRRGG